jgi:hypothetical protein
MIFFCRAALRASRAPTTSAGWACEKVEMTRSMALEPSGLVSPASAVSWRAMPTFS